MNSSFEEKIVTQGINSPSETQGGLAKQKNYITEILWYQGFYIKLKNNIDIFQRSPVIGFVTLN